jgi:hypothetical protein
MQCVRFAVMLRAGACIEKQLGCHSEPTAAFSPAAALPAQQPRPSAFVKALGRQFAVHIHNNYWCCCTVVQVACCETATKMLAHSNVQLSSLEPAAANSG